MRQIISINPDDDSADIRAQIENAEFSQLVLVAPRGVAALASDSAMLLLRRAAEDAGVHIAIVTREAELRDRADRFGVPTFQSIHQAQRGQWQMEQPVYRLTGEKISLADSIAAGDGIGAWVRQQRKAIALLSVALIFLCLAGFLFVPAARIRLIPAPISITINADISADPTISQVSSAQRWLPARKMSREISGNAQLRTTTQKSLPDARSGGAVIFTNLRDSEVTIPQNAIVKTSGGVAIRFSVVTTTTLPAGIGNRVETPVQALDPGTSGNVKELTINQIEGSLNLEARVINLKPLTQGNARNVRVVTAEDKKKLEAQLLEQLQKQGIAALNGLATPTDLLLTESVFIDANEVTFDRAVDEPADALNLRISGYALGLAVDRADMELLVRALVLRELQEGYALMPNGITAEALPGGKYAYPAFRFPLRGIGSATPQIDNAKVARAVQSKSIADARAVLSEFLPLAQPPEITTLPPGWLWMPWLAFRIAVFVEP